VQDADGEMRGKMSESEALGYLLGGSPALVGVRSGQELTLGRHPEAGIVLPFTSVSRRHAILRATADGLVLLSDQESHNGTCWRGHRLGLEPVWLGGSGVISAGNRTLPYVSREYTDELPQLNAKAAGQLRQQVTWGACELKSPDEGGLWPAIDDPIFASDTMVVASLSADEAPLPAELKGQTNQLVPVPLLLYLLGSRRASGKIYLDAPACSGWVTLDHGQLVAAQVDRVHGFHALLVWAAQQQVDFRFERCEPRAEGPPSAAIPTAKLIYECCAYMEDRPAHSR
jgi:hypothetical protein